MKDMRTSKTKWALIAALAVPGVALNSCVSTLLTEVRDAAIGAASDFTRTTTLDLLGTTTGVDVSTAP